MDLLIFEFNVFGIWGLVCFCDDWICIWFEVLFKEYNVVVGVNGNLLYDEIDYESIFKENFENGYLSGFFKFFL